MRPYKTLIMLLAFLLLYYASHKVLQKKEKKEEQEEKGKKIFSYLDVKNVASLSVRNEFGLFEFKRAAGGDWDILSPIKDEASKSAIDEIVNNTKNLEVKKNLSDESIKDLSIFGLAQSSVEINLSLTDNKKITLFIGNKTPDDSSLYLREGSQKKVFVVGTSLENIKTKKLGEFREKKIFSFIKDDVLELNLTNQNGSFVIKKVDGQKYLIEKPTKMQGGKSEIEKVINTLVNARVDEFISEKFDNPEQYNLNKPAIRIDLTLKDNKKTGLILSEKKGDEQKYYAKKSDKENVYEVSSQLYKDLDMKLADLILKKLIEFEKDAAKRIDYTVNDKNFTFVKKGENEWGVLPPWNFTPSPSEISSLLNKVKNTETSDIIKDKIESDAKYGFDKPGLKMVVTTDDAGKEVAGFVIGKEKDQDNYFMKRISANFVLSVNKNDIDKFPKEKNDFREKNLVSFNRDDILKIALFDAKKNKTFTRDEKEWILETNGDKSKNPPNIEGLITDVRSLKVFNFIENQKNDAEYGLNNPKLTIEIESNKKERISLIIGKAEENNYYAKLANKSEIVTIEKFRIENIIKKFND